MWFNMEASPQKHLCMQKKKEVSKLCTKNRVTYHYKLLALPGNLLCNDIAGERCHS